MHIHTYIYKGRSTFLCLCERQREKERRTTDHYYYNCKYTSCTTFHVTIRWHIKSTKKKWFCRKSEKVIVTGMLQERHCMHSNKAFLYIQYCWTNRGWWWWRRQWYLHVETIRWRNHWVFHFLYFCFGYLRGMEGVEWVMACMGHLFISLCMLGKHIYLVCSRQVVYYQVQVEKERTLHCFILLTQLHLMLFFSLSLTCYVFVREWVKESTLHRCTKIFPWGHVLPFSTLLHYVQPRSFLHSISVTFLTRKQKNIILSIKILLLFFSFILELFHTIHLVFQSWPMFSVSQVLVCVCVVKK